MIHSTPDRSAPQYDEEEEEERGGQLAGMIASQKERRRQEEDDQMFPDEVRPPMLVCLHALPVS